MWCVVKNKIDKGQYGAIKVNDSFIRKQLAVGYFNIDVKLNVYSLHYQCLNTKEYKSKGAN